MANTREIILKNGRFIRREVIEQDLGSQDHVIASLATQQNIFLKGVIPFNDHGISILSNGKTLIMTTQLTKLPFKTYFEPEQSVAKYLVPVFAAHRGTILIEDSWPVFPILGSIHFGVQFLATSTCISGFTPVGAHMWLYHKRELRHFPYPNLYPDGRVCMGGVYDNNRGTGKSLVDDFLKAHSSFYSTAMNNHLTSENSCVFFRRTYEGQWMAPPDNWERMCPVVSNSFMEGFSP